METPQKLFIFQKTGTPKNLLIFSETEFFAKKTRSEKISYIFSNESFSYVSGNETLHFSVQARKIKKICPKKISQEKVFLILQETKIQKKFLIFSPEKGFLIFWKTETPKYFLIFQETETLKNFLYFRK